MRGQQIPMINTAIRPGVTKQTVLQYIPMTNTVLKQGVTAQIQTEM